MDAIADNHSHKTPVATPVFADAESDSTDVRRLERQLGNLAALTELIARISSADNAAAACQILADQLQNHWSAEEVFVGLCRAGSPDCRLTAISGVPAFHPGAEQAQAAQAVLQEAIARGEIAVWPAADVSQSGGLMAHKQFAATRDTDSTIVSSALRDPRGQLCGAWMVAIRSGGASYDEVSAFLAPRSPPSLRQYNWSSGARKVDYSKR